MTTKQTSQKVNPAPVCKNCTRWKQFKNSCWVHWEGKKVCSQYIDEAGNTFSPEHKEEWELALEQY
jgi:hypothetical protein